MNRFRATNAETGEVVEYDADLPQDAHRSPPWTLEQLFIAEPSPDDPPTPYNGPWLVTKLAFRQRFTEQEKITIDLASIDDPAASDQQRQLAAALRANAADVAAAEYIDLARSDTRSGVNDLETYGLIAAGRAAVILDTEPTAEERWNG